VSTTPFVAFSNRELAGNPELRPGDTIECPSCGGRHLVGGGSTLLTYSCGGGSFVAAIDGKSLVGLPVECAKNGKGAE